LTGKNCLPYNLYCVGGDVKHCSISQSIAAGLTDVWSVLWTNRPAWSVLLVMASNPWTNLTDWVDVVSLCGYSYDWTHFTVSAFSASILQSGLSQTWPQFLPGLFIHFWWWN